jgi:D-alanyl-D-alanine carboxypeptidase/D-alanyl-D-alanine-endopeptidase (penicillin-binding protein 4)
MALKTWQVTTGAAVLGLLIAAGTVVAAGPWDSSGQRTAERNWAAEHGRGGGADHGEGGADGEPSGALSAPPVLAALGVPAGGSGRAASGRVPTEQSLRALLDPLLADGSLGRSRTAAVVDVATGRQVYGRQAGQALTPASTTKLATAVAALSAVGADHHIATRAVLQGDAHHGTPRVVLVGGGDPTLTARADAQGSASLRTLAEATARELKARHVRRVTLAYDDSLYTGPRLHVIGPNENLTAVTALMADEGRRDDSTSGPAPRSTDPSGDATAAFAGFLKDHGIAVQGRPGAAKTSGGAKSLATVQSPPLSSLVERMLTNSDNDIAEALARQTALVSHQPVSFAGGAKAIGARLARLGLPMSGAAFADGSGLDRADRLSADLLTSLLAVAAAPGHPELRPVLTGLPVAGFTGTLEHRYAGADLPGTGLVRAKTGTLTGVNTLAGTVVDTDGRLLAFAVMTAGSTSPAATQSALDHLATALTECGCG